jgi:hypothetical protein
MMMIIPVISMDAKKGTKENHFFYLSLSFTQGAIILQKYSHIEAKIETMLLHFQPHGKTIMKRKREPKAFTNDAFLSSYKHLLFRYV